MLREDGSTGCRFGQKYTDAHHSSKTYCSSSVHGGSGRWEAPVSAATAMVLVFHRVDVERTATPTPVAVQTPPGAAGRGGASARGGAAASTALSGHEEGRCCTFVKSCYTADVSVRHVPRTGLAREIPRSERGHALAVGASTSSPPWRVAQRSSFGRLIVVKMMGRGGQIHLRPTTVLSLYLQLYSPTLISDASDDVRGGFSLETRLWRRIEFDVDTQDHPR